MAKPKVQLDSAGAIDLREGANGKEVINAYFEEELDIISARKTYKPLDEGPTKQETERALADWAMLLRQLTADLRPVFAARGLILESILQVSGFDFKVFVVDKQQRRFDADISVESIEEYTQGIDKDVFIVIKEMILARVCGARDAYHERVKSLTQEIREKSN